MLKLDLGVEGFPMKKFSFTVFALTFVFLFTSFVADDASNGHNAFASADDQIEFIYDDNADDITESNFA